MQTVQNINDIKYFTNQSNIKTFVVEPNIKHSKLNFLNLASLSYVNKKSDLIVILVNHDQFKKKIFRSKIDLLDISGLLR